MSKFVVQLFGKFSAKRGGQTLTKLDGKKPQELFCYLLLNRRRPHNRETLAGFLWGEVEAAQSKKSLRQALWQVLSSLNCQEEASADCFLLVEPDWISINSQADLWLD
ncbi:MAG TPA: hypothetical protein VEZ90_02315, partial [Blastocatellia bacterium]|nr:hypothetical protein [Blastocatellia bacterium]